MTDRRALALLALLHLAMVAIVQPRGEFPVNDDWAFAQSVRWLLAEGRLRLSDWVPMYLAPQALAGGAVAALFGFSFEALRHLTQAVALAALAGAYAFFRACGLELRAAFVASVAIAAFPAWPVLANSYMTDLYALALALPCAALFVMALREPSRGGFVVAAILFAVAGVLQRQVVLALPFAFMAAWLWTRRPITPRMLAIGVAPLVIAAAALVAFQAYLAAGPGVPEMHRLTGGRLLRVVPKVLSNEGGAARWALSNFTSMAGYLGLFSVGWLAWWGMRGASLTERTVVAAGGLAILAAAFAFDWLPPYRAKHVLDAAGIGPFMLYDEARGRAPLDRGAGIFWIGLAIPAAFATAAVVLAMAKAIAGVLRARACADPRVVFLCTAVVAYLGPFIVTDYFDRYLLFALPFLVALWALSWREGPQPSWRRYAALSWLVIAIGLSCLATRDYFSWNRARWDAIRLAEKLGGDAHSIDGGFEHGGLLRFETRPAEVADGKSWYWVRDDRYVVSFSSVEGYEVVETWPVARTLPRTPREVKLLRRKP